MKNLISILLLFVSFGCFGQLYQTGSGSITISPLFSFTISNTSATLSLTTIDQVKNGKTQTNFSTISVKSNKNWQMTVKAQSSVFSLLSGILTGNPMQASALKIKASGEGGWKTLSTSAQVLKTGNRGNTSAPGNTFTTDIKFEPGLTSKGGIYSIALVYTLSQP